MLYIGKVTESFHRVVRSLNLSRTRLGLIHYLSRKKSLELPKNMLNNYFDFLIYFFTGGTIREDMEQTTKTNA